MIQGPAIDTQKIFIRGRIGLRYGMLSTSAQQKHANYHQTWSRYPVKTFQSLIPFVHEIANLILRRDKLANPEDEVGFSYAEIDRILWRLVDRRLSLDEVVADGFERAVVERVDRMVAGSEFKRQVPPIAKIGPRTAGIDYLYPRRRPGSART